MAVAGAGKILIVEILFTFALCWVVLNMGDRADLAVLRCTGQQLVRRRGLAAAAAAAVCVRIAVAAVAGDRRLPA
jgi:hypothetical protein